MGDYRSDMFGPVNPTSLAVEKSRLFVLVKELEQEQMLSAAAHTELETSKYAYKFDYSFKSVQANLLPLVATSKFSDAIFSLTSSVTIVLNSDTVLLKRPLATDTKIEAARVSFSRFTDNSYQSIRVGGNEYSERYNVLMKDFFSNAQLFYFIYFGGECLLIIVASIFMIRYVFSVLMANREVMTLFAMIEKNQIEDLKTECNEFIGRFLSDIREIKKAVVVEESPEAKSAQKDEYEVQAAIEGKEEKGKSKHDLKKEVKSGIIKTKQDERKAEAAEKKKGKEEQNKLMPKSPMMTVNSEYDNMSLAMERSDQERLNNHLDYQDNEVKRTDLYKKTQSEHPLPNKSVNLGTNKVPDYQALNKSENGGKIFVSEIGTNIGNQNPPIATQGNKTTAQPASDPKLPQDKPGEKKPPELENNRQKAFRVSVTHEEDRKKGQPLPTLNDGGDQLELNDKKREAYETVDLNEPLEGRNKHLPKSGTKKSKAEREKEYRLRAQKMEENKLTRQQQEERDEEIQNRISKLKNSKDSNKNFVIVKFILSALTCIALAVLSFIWTPLYFSDSSTMLDILSRIAQQNLAIKMSFLLFAEELTRRARLPLPASGSDLFDSLHDLSYRNGNYLQLQVNRFPMGFSVFQGEFRTLLLTDVCSAYLKPVKGIGKAQVIQSAKATRSLCQALSSSMSIPYPLPGITSIMCVKQATTPPL